MKNIDVNELSVLKAGKYWTSKRLNFVNGFSCTALGLSIVLSLASAPTTFGASLAATGIMYTSFAACVATLPEEA